VSGGEFRQAVQVEIDVVLPMLVHTGEGIIEQGQGAVRARQARDRGNIGNPVDGIGGALEHHQPRWTCGQRALDGIEVRNR
jgi:hypothetical protein